MDSPNLRQAINTLTTTFNEVCRLVNLINDLPIYFAENLLEYDLLKRYKITPYDVELLRKRLIHSTIIGDINNGIVADIPDEATVARRLKHLKFSLRQSNVAKIDDIELVYGDEIPTTSILSRIMEYAEAYDYIDTVGSIFKEWNLIYDCLINLISEIENEFVNPQPDTTELPPIFQQYDIFKDNASVAKVFVSLIDEGLIKIDGNLFRWLDDRNSLCYFCYSLNLHYDLNTKNNNVPWVSFKNMFLCKIWGKWVEQTNNDLRDNWQQYLKNAKSEYDPNGEQGKILPPRGKQKIWEKIENSML